MSLDEILRRPYYRRISIALLCAVVVILWLLRYFALPYYDASLTETFSKASAKFFEDLSSAVITTLILSLLLLFISPRFAGESLIVLSASELKGAFAEALATSNSWWFYGGCGRYFRSAVLDKIAERASAEGATKSARAIILNPGNKSLCEAHATYRAATSEGRRDGLWTARRVKCELVATIVIALRATGNNGLLDVQLFLSDHFSTFRADISDQYAIETREDPKAPALRSLADTDFYKALKTEFTMLSRQSIEVRDPMCNCIRVEDPISLRIAVESLSIPGLTLEDSECDEIMKIIDNYKNPHA